MSLFSPPRSQQNKLQQQQQQQQQQQPLRPGTQQRLPASPLFQPRSLNDSLTSSPLLKPATIEQKPPPPPPYRLENDPVQGRYTVASSDVPANTALLTCTPYAYAIFDSHKKRVCGVCLDFNDNGAFHLHCRNCDQVYLCSPACLANLLANGHHVVCGALRRLATHKAPQHEKSVLKILLMTLYARHVERGRNVHISNTLRDAISLASAPPFILNGSAAENKPAGSVQQGSDQASALGEAAILGTGKTWAEVDNLQSHYSSWPLEDAKDWRKTKNLIVKLLEDCGLLENGDRVPPIPRGDPSDFVLHLVSKIESNGFGLWSPKTEQCMGRALFPNASYFNHSCDPNTSATQAADEITFRTKRPVKQNEPLTISYIDANIPLHARRSRLQQEYYFHCMCSRCVAEEARVPSAAKVGSPRPSSIPNMDLGKDQGMGSANALHPLHPLPTNPVMQNAYPRKVTYERSFNQNRNRGKAVSHGPNRAAQGPKGPFNRVDSVPTSATPIAAPTNPNPIPTPDAPILLPISQPSRYQPVVLSPPTPPPSSPAAVECISPASVLASSAHLHSGISSPPITNQSVITPPRDTYSNSHGPSSGGVPKSRPPPRQGQAPRRLPLGAPDVSEVRQRAVANIRKLSNARPRRQQGQVHNQQRPAGQYQQQQHQNTPKDTPAPASSPAS